jgi:hypothetical protein
VRQNRIIVIVAIVTVLASTLIVLLQGGEGKNTDAAQQGSTTSATYVVLPRSLTLAGDFSFRPLRRSQFSAVRITTPRAIQLASRAASVRSGSLSSSSKVTVSLGSFINKEEIVTDWIGTKSLIPKAVPVYVVMISGLHFESLGPGGGVNHEYDVVVNASNGEVLEELTYH